MINSIGSFSGMKSINTSLVLNKIREHGSVSRAHIAKETGLTGATVSNLTSELIKSKIIIESNTGCSTGGRKPIMLRLNTADFGICSAYISPNRVEFAVSNFEADILYYNSIPISDKNDAAYCADYIEREYKNYTKYSEREIVGMGLGLHGIVDCRSGVAVFAPNLGWNNVSVEQMLCKRLGIPVLAENDVRLMTMGEMWYGIAKNTSDLVFVYVGNGIGGAIVINGELYRGFKSGSGEIGHCTVDADGELCSCGNRGCLQTKANRSAMLASMREFIKSEETILTQDSSCEDIVKACIYNNDKAACRVIDREAKYLGIAVTNLINTFNPQLVVLDSDIAGFEKAVMTPLSNEISSRKMKFFDSSTKIKYSYLGDMAVLKGGIAYVLKNIFDNPSLINNRTKGE